MINEKQNEKWIKINHSEIVEIHILILAYFHICIIIFFFLKMLRKLYIIYTCIHISGSWTFPVLFINKPLVKQKMKIIFNFFCRWLNISFNMKTSSDIALFRHSSNEPELSPLENRNCLPLKKEQETADRHLSLLWKKSSTFDKKIFICLSYVRHHLVNEDGQMYGFRLSF